MRRLHAAAAALLLARTLSTFREKYCAACGCDREAFAARLFWRCLHRHALPLAPIIAVVQPDYFARDRELIALAGKARTMRELNEEIRLYVDDARNYRWWPRQARVRRSTRRLRRIAWPFLAAETALS